MPPGLQESISAVWIAFLAVWTAAAFTVKQAARTQPAGSRLAQSGLMAVAFVFLFTGWLRYGPLAWRFAPASSRVAWLGFALTLAGAALAVWARIFLGRNWSGTVTIKQDHHLVRRGPYAFVRHPIYSGILLALLGTAIAFGEVRGLAGVGAALGGFLLKSRLEEAFLAEQFGAEYARYRREVRAFLPFVW